MKRKIVRIIVHKDIAEYTSWVNYTHAKLVNDGVILSSNKASKSWKDIYIPNRLITLIDYK